MGTRRYRRGKVTFKIPPVVRLWLLRLLIPIGAHSQFITPMGFNDDAPAEQLGLDEWAIHLGGCA